MKSTLAISIVVCGLMLTAGCTFQTDSTAPKDLKILINNGAKSTNITTVELQLSMNGSEGPTKMSFSNDGATWSGWASYNSHVTWALSSEDGIKTVYFKVKNTVNNKLAGPVNATILLDTTTPTATLSVPSAGAVGVDFNIPSITVSFNEEMQLDSFGACPFSIHGYQTGESMSGYWLGHDKYVCNLTKNLSPASKYVVETDSGPHGLKDAAGNLVKVTNWTFTTRPGYFQVLSKAIYHTNDGTRVYAVVKNIDNFSFENIGLDLSFKDSSGKFLFNMHDHVNFIQYNALMVPGDTAPYSTKVIDEQGVIKDVDIKAGTNAAGDMWTTKDNFYKGLTVFNTTSGFDSGGYTVSGKVKNTGNKSVGDLQLQAAFYDSTGGLICIGGAGYQNLGTGMTVDFGVSVGSDLGNISKISTYHLYIYGGF